MPLKTIFLLILFPVFITAQSPYQINWKMEPYYLGTGAVTMAAGLYLGQQLDPLTLDEIYTLDRANVNSFDRNATFKFSIKASSKSDILMISSAALPLFFLSDRKTRNDFGKIYLMYGETLLITGGITVLSKVSTKRPRPFVYNEIVSLAKKQNKHARRSFFSGHASMTTTSCFFAAKVFSDYYPDSKLKPYVWTSFIILPAITSYLRVKAGKHYYSDVITGYVIGATVGFLVPHLHKTREDKALSFKPTLNGFVMTWKISNP